MSSWEIAGAVIGAGCFVIWIPCLISWLSRGITIPRSIHLLAGALTCIGLGCLISMLTAGMASLNLSVILIVAPPALTYLGWFWMFGPELSSADG